MPDLAKSKELREKRANLVEQNKTVLAQIDAEKDAARVKELEAQWDQRDADIVALSKTIERLERQESLEADLDRPLNERKSGRGAPGGGSNPGDAKAAYGKAWRNFVRFGAAEMSAEERQILRGGYVADNESRAQTVTTTGGGYLIPEDFQRELEKALLDYSGVLSAPTRKIMTDTGASLPWPTVNDTSNKGQLLGINTQESEQAMTFGVVTFDAYKFTSKSVLVPVELLQDSAFNIDSMLANLLAERIGRILEQYYTTGSGSNQPNGIVTASTAGVTASTPAAVTFDDITDLIHSVDPAYRRLPSAGFMFNDSTLKAVKKLKDSDNRPLWLPGYALREPDTILGYPYWINQEMSSIGGSTKSMLFGAMEKYVVRTVKDITLMRLVERYADYYQVGFQAWMRADGDLIDAGTRPIKHLVNQSG